jgi:CheY-like chemotaxis protein
MLERSGELQIVGQASDGLEALQKAEELQPDLILLDIGLPKLSGFEAGRQIRTLYPTSRILFLSQESDAEVVQEALRLGAQGYLLKLDAARELLLAVDTVLQGKQFVSSHLRPLAIPNTRDEHLVAPLQPAEPLTPRRSLSHEVVMIGIAWVLYTASWFIQTIKGGATLTQGTLPGWESFRTGLFLEGFKGPLIVGVIDVLSALSNLLMMASPVILLSRFDKLKRLLPWLLMLTAILNMQWFILSKDRADLRAGYYLWCASFFVIAIASFIINQRRSATPSKRRRPMRNSEVILERTASQTS